MVEHKEGLVRVAVCGLYEAEEIDGLQAQLRRAKREAKAWRRDEEARTDTGFIQVSFVGDDFTRRYTYRDPQQMCKLGDLVEVPVGFDNRIAIAKVVDLAGSGTRDQRNRITKEVAAILTRTVL